MRQSLLLGALMALNMVAFLYRWSCFDSNNNVAPSPSALHIDTDYRYFRDTFPTALGLPAFGNPDLSETEHLQLEGAKLFQRFLFASQFKKCQTSGTTVRVLSLPPEHRYGFFSQLQGAAHSLLEAVVNDHVLSWSKFQSFYVDQARCPARTFDCYFLPITSCDNPSAAASVVVLRRESMRNSCVFEYPRRRMSEQPFIPNNTAKWKDKLVLLREKSGIAALQRDELFSPHFFVREALRFITRPNPQMRGMMQELMATEFKPSNAKWQPFTYPYARVSVHIRAGEDKKAHTGVLGTEYYSRVLDRIETTNIMEVLFSSDSREAHAEFAQYLAATKNKQGQFIAQSRFGDLTSLFHDSLSTPKTDLGMLLMAQCFIFATTDLFVGFVPSNVAQTVHLLMGALRHTSMVPVLDSGGSPMSSCHHFTEYPLRIIRHPHLTA